MNIFPPVETMCTSSLNHHRRCIYIVYESSWATRIHHILKRSWKRRSRKRRCAHRLYSVHLVKKTFLIFLTSFVFPPWGPSWAPAERPCPHRGKTTATPASPPVGRGGDKGIVTGRSEPNEQRTHCRGSCRCQCRGRCRGSSRATRRSHCGTKPTSSSRRNRRC